MPIPFLAAAGAQVVGGLITAYQSNRAAKEAQTKANQFSSQLAKLEANRQEIVDPSAAIQDRSSMIQNQFANLQVATQAAEFQAEEADVSLANTLDTLRATGAGAGGATALAQAALRSKRDISQSIERQEAANVMARAQGAQAAQSARLAEGQRVDAAKMAGQEFMFRAREARETAKMDRVANLADQQAALARANKQASQSALAGAFGAAAGGLIGAYSGAGKSSPGSNTGGSGTADSFTDDYNPAGSLYGKQLRGKLGLGIIE